MPNGLKTIADVVATAFVYVASPLLSFLAKHRTSLPRVQRLADKLHLQILSTHYYSPTYREDHLPAETNIERSLPGLDLNAAVQLEMLSHFQFADELRSLPLETNNPMEFGFRNPMYSYGDAETLYSIIRHKKPELMIEIGSGNSTLIAQLAFNANLKENPSYRWRQICIEPYEAPWLEQIGVKVIRERVERVSLTLFDQLNANDILFIDSSHVIRPWGDVLREFQQIIPRLKSNVLVHIDDIFTPRDYPEHWLRKERRYWNEQYLMEAFLVFNTTYEVVLATNWLKHNYFDILKLACPILGEHPEHEPGAFWIKRC